ARWRDSPIGSATLERELVQVEPEAWRSSSTRTSLIEGASIEGASGVAARLSSEVLSFPGRGCRDEVSDLSVRCLDEKVSGRPLHHASTAELRLLPLTMLRVGIEQR